jgi:hypothetical protein
MPRPRKPDGEKYVPLTTNLPPRAYAAFKRVADARGIHVAHLVRIILLGRFRTLKTEES